MVRDFRESARNPKGYALIIDKKQNLSDITYTLSETVAGYFFALVYFQFILQGYNTDWVIGRKGSKYDKKEKTVN